MGDTLALSPPAPGLIAQLNVRTWLDHTVDGRVFAPMLITYPAPQFEDVDSAEVELQMRGVAASLGAVPTELSTDNDKSTATTGARVSIHQGGAILVHFEGSHYALRVLKSARWAGVIANLGHVLLAVGLDELSAVASRAEVDEYIEHAGRTGRIHAAVADVAVSPRHVQRAILPSSGGSR
ncbi:MULTISPECIES: hypothetical protein [unclassified Streptomyces]|uniref:hypothetical protein n=1 Tax=unclassified Streptomyces TaxID=2593676 RepID=UPI0034287711